MRVQGTEPKPTSIFMSFFSGNFILADLCEDRQKCQYMSNLPEKKKDIHGAY